MFRTEIDDSITIESFEFSQHDEEEEKIMQQTKSEEKMFRQVQNIPEKTEISSFFKERGPLPVFSTSK